MMSGQLPVIKRVGSEDKNPHYQPFFCRAIAHDTAYPALPYLLFPTIGFWGGNNQPETHTL